MENIRKSVFMLVLAVFFTLSLNVQGLAPDDVSAVANTEEEHLEEPGEEPSRDSPDGVLVKASEDGGDTFEDDEDDQDREPDLNTVLDEAGLQDWIDEHAETGGTVKLGGPIVITSTIVGPYSGGRIVIDTEEYGLIYGGGVLSLYDFEITGQGVDMPVLEFVSRQRAWYESGNWNNDLMQLIVTATGRGGVGGVAVRVGTDDGCDFDMTTIVTGGRIVSRGAGAVGLELLVPLDAYCFDIETQGEGSAAVSAQSGGTLRYSKLKATGGGVSVSGNAALDTCLADPVPQGVVSINRQITALSGKRLYLPVAQGETMLFPDYIYTFWLSGDDAFPPLRQSFPVSFDLYEDDDVSRLLVDTSVIGRHSVAARLFPAFAGLGLEGDFPLELIVDVRDPALPCFADVYFSDYDGNRATMILMVETEKGDVILRRSDDGGENWRDAGNDPDIEWMGFDSGCYAISYSYDSLTHPVLFVLEKPGSGFSNVVTLYEEDGVPMGDNGGDRTGVDRDGADNGAGGNTGNENPGDSGEDKHTNGEQPSENEYSEDTVGGEAPKTPEPSLPTSAKPELPVSTAPAPTGTVGGEPSKTPEPSPPTSAEPELPVSTEPALDPSPTGAETDIPVATEEVLITPESVPPAEIPVAEVKTVAAIRPSSVQPSGGGSKTDAVSPALEATPNIQPNIRSQEIPSTEKPRPASEVVPLPSPAVPFDDDMAIVITGVIVLILATFAVVAKLRARHE